VKSYFYGAAAAALGVLSLPAFAQQGPVWQPHVDVEAKPGSKRNIGEADFFLPLWQDGRGLLFGNARLRVADHDNREGNLGLGYRRMLEGGWNIGGYGYFDRRRSTTGNYFNQVTLGAEALGTNWDFRGNVYLPQGDKVRDLGSTTTGGVSTAAIVGTAVQVTTTGSTTFQNQERALKGYDVEAGWRAPIWAAEADKQLRLYAGGYHFSDAGIRVSGPRVRVELTMAELPALWKGAQLTLGAEYQDDNARGGQGFVSARIRIPLGSDKNTGYKMNWQERRMAAPTVRDVDVVTQSRAVAVASTPATVETATQTAGGQAITVLDSGTTTGAALPGAVAGAGNNSVVLLSGSFNTTAAVNLQTGQTLMGAGTLNVMTASGRTVAVTTPGATIASTDATNNTGIVNMANNGTVTGMTLTRNASPTNSYGINAAGNTGVTISNNTITLVNPAGGTSHGIRAIGGASGVISGNTVSATGPGIAVGINTTGAAGITVSGNTAIATAQQAYGLFMNGGTGTLSGNTLTGISSNGASNANGALFDNGAVVTVTGNTLRASGGLNDFVIEAGSTTFNPGSTGNINNGGVCQNTGGNTGTASFTDGSTCP
jgi:hypothetical protein